MIKANPFMLRMTVIDLPAKSIREVERDRQEMIVIAPQPQQRPLARARPAARETLPASVAHTKNCKLTSCRKVSALHARTASTRPARRT